MGVFKACDAIELPEGTEEIQAGEFAFSAKLRSVKLPSTLKKIGAWAFDGCEALEYVAFSEGVEEIGNYAFAKCKSLRSVELPTTLKRIGKGAFRFCKSLKSVALSGGVEIGRNAFEGTSPHLSIAQVVAPLPIRQHVSEPVPESVPEPVPEPIVAPTPIPQPESAPVPEPEPVSEPVVASTPVARPALPPDVLPPLPHSPRAGDRALFRIDGVEFAFRYCPPGEFMMGSPEDEPGRYADEKQHRVRLTKGFWLLETQVTQGMWESLMGATVEEQAQKTLHDDRAYEFSTEIQTIRELLGFSRDMSPRDALCGTGSDLPIYYVSWYESVDFCRKLSGKLNHQIQLPTEAQWEYACRAGSRFALPYGPIEIKGRRHAPALDPIAWYGGNSSQSFADSSPWNSSVWADTQYPGGPCGVHPVGRKDANAWGLHDMTGNVKEWCSDFYSSEYYAESPTINPEKTTASTSWLRVNRGGGWFSLAERCRAAYRGRLDPNVRSHCLGLRALLVPESGENESAESNSSADAVPASIVAPPPIRNKTLVRTVAKNTFKERAFLEFLVIHEGVEAIEDGAFAECKRLRNATLPSTLKKIGAFAFSGCEALEAIALPEGVEELGAAAFEKCASLRSVTLPSTLKKIGAFAFSGCESLDLEALALPEDVEGLPGFMFDDDNLPAGLKERNVWAAFAERAFLKAVEVPEGVEELGPYAFNGCRNLRRVKLPATLKTIGELAFGSCASLESVEIPQTVEALGKSAFLNCSALRSVKLSAALKRIGELAFRGCEYLETIEIPEGVEELGPCAFVGCRNLRRARLPSTLKKISVWAFWGCGNLQTVEIPRGVEEIGDSAFEGCESLRSAYLPSSLKHIGKGAFLGCPFQPADR